jgi:hypothetical protein
MESRLGERVNIRDLVVDRPYLLSLPNWNDQTRPFISRVFVTSKERVNIPGQMLDGMPVSFETYRIYVKPVTDTRNRTLGDMMTITVEDWESEKFYKDKRFSNVIDSINKQPSKKIKDIAMRELRAMPGAVDYEETKARFGKGLKTRKRRHRLKRTMKRKNGRHLIRSV